MRMSSISGSGEELEEANLKRGDIALRGACSRHDSGLPEALGASFEIGLKRCEER